MKTIKLLLGMLVIGMLFTSCIVDNTIDEPYYATLEEVVTANDLWYIDYNNTNGTGDVPFLSKAFTISFINGNVYANNNLVGIGTAGNGFGIQIGYYDTFDGSLKIDHNLDGFYNFEVIQLTV